MRKQKVAVVCGGYSSEYDVSIQSAKQVAANIDRDLFNVYTLLIEDDGWWVTDQKEKPILVDMADCTIVGVDSRLVIFDCAYIVIHGTPGEDGKLQGYFDILGIPYTTSDILTTSLTFNKQMCKNFLRSFDVLSAEAVLLRDGDKWTSEGILAKTGLPCIVKPNNGGSSCGASKVTTANELPDAIEKAFKEDTEILIEQYISGREFTCGVVCRNDSMFPLPVTEVISKKEFFDYEAKYTTGLSDEITPAQISDELTKECQDLAVKIATALNCKGVVRIDFIHNDNKFYFLEVNSTPGMSEHSIIPKQLEAYGLSMKDFTTMLITDALQRKPELFTAYYEKIEN